MSDSVLEPIDTEQQHWLMVHLYLQGQSMRKIARDLDVSHTSVSRYLNTPEAQGMIAQYRDSMANLLTAQLETASIVALRTASGVAADPDEDAVVRLKAVEIIAQHFSKLTKVARSATMESTNLNRVSRPRDAILDVILSEDDDVDAAE